MAKLTEQNYTYRDYSVINLALDKRGLITQHHSIQQKSQTWNNEEQPTRLQYTECFRMLDYFQTDHISILRITNRPPSVLKSLKLVFSFVMH